MERLDAVNRDDIDLYTEVVYAPFGGVPCYERGKFTSWSSDGKAAFVMYGEQTLPKRTSLTDLWLPFPPGILMYTNHTNPTHDKTMLGTSAIVDGEKRYKVYTINNKTGMFEVVQPAYVTTWLELVERYPDDVIVNNEEAYEEFKLLQLVSELEYTDEQ